MPPPIGIAAPIALVTRLGRHQGGLTLLGRVAVRADGSRMGTLGDAQADDRAVAEALAQMPHGTARTVKSDTEDLLIEAK